jgi:hypothetical protein
MNSFVDRLDTIRSVGHNFDVWEVAQHTTKPFEYNRLRVGYQNTNWVCGHL